MTEKLNHRPIIGYTDQETVKLDFDNTPFKTVKYWALRTMRWFKLGGFIVLKSSKNSYHAVFDRGVSWSENMRIVAWVSLHAHIQPLHRWFLMQCIKEASTFRISPKKGKSSPKIIYRHCKQDEQIRNFLQYRRTIKRIIRKLKITYQREA